MYIGYAILGLIIGLFVTASGSYHLLGAVGGAVIGILLVRLTRLNRRVQQLESERQQENIPLWGQAPESPAERPLQQTAVPATPQSLESTAEPQAEEAFDQEPAIDKSQPDPWGQPEKVQALPAQIADWLSIPQGLLKKASAWFSSGNVPVKVGVIISFIGVAFLLKYAIDSELLVIPLELRLLAVAVAGMALLMIGWRLRDKARVYALSLQGGGIGILFLTIFAALRLWQLLPPTLAFFLLVALTFFTATLAVLQNSRSLVILGITGGFLAPVLTSTGQGSHVALFSYYLVLNGAILGIAWYRTWRELNLIGFVFTFLIGSAWGYQYYKPELYASTQPFLLLYFLFYQAIAILYALRAPPDRLGMVDGTLVFGTPVIAFSLQAALVHNMEYGLAISAAVTAVFYALVASWLFRKKDNYLRLLTESFMAMAVAFATVTIPLALDARWTAASWALEGAALVWLGTRQGRQLAKLAGAALIFFSGAAFLDYGWKWNVGLPVLNGNVLGGLLISLSALFASRKFGNVTDQGFRLIHKLITLMLFTWGVFWWFGTGFMEINDRLDSNHEPYVAVLFLSLSMGAAAWLGHTRQWSMLRRTSFYYLPALGLFALMALVFVEHHFLHGLGWLAWPLAVVAQGFVLWLIDKHEERLAHIWHFGTVLFFTALVLVEATWWVDQLVTVTWAEAVAAVVMGVMAMLIWRFRKHPAWPVPQHPMTYLYASLVLVVFLVLYLAGISMQQPGNPTPLPYIPVLNPYDLAMLFSMLTASLSLLAIQREPAITENGKIPQYLLPYKLLLAITFFIMTTFALVRGVHHYTGVNWNDNALFASVIVQTSLSIYWGLLGFVGMIWGARRGRRPVWLAGAGFMALVVIKLFIVDLGNTGTIERIISFIGIGALLLVVGYFAPAPPRNTQGSSDADNQEKERI